MTGPRGSSRERRRAQVAADVERIKDAARQRRQAAYGLGRQIAGIDRDTVRSVSRAAVAGALLGGPAVALAAGLVILLLLRRRRRQLCEQQLLALNAGDVRRQLDAYFSALPGRTTQLRSSQRAVRPKGTRQTALLKPLGRGID